MREMTTEIGKRLQQINDKYEDVVRPISSVYDKALKKAFKVCRKELKSAWLSYEAAEKKAWIFDEPASKSAWKDYRDKVKPILKSESKAYNQANKIFKAAIKPHYTNWQAERKRAFKKGDNK